MQGLSYPNENPADKKDGDAGKLILHPVEQVDEGK